MLVDDGLSAPAQALAHCDHRAREGQGLLGRHEARAGDQEGGDVHVGPTVVGDIPHHLQVLGFGQRFARHLGADPFEGAWRSRRRHLDRRACRHAQPVEQRLGQTHLVNVDQSRIVADHRRRQQAASSGADLDGAQTSQSLRPEGLAIAGQDDDVFPERVQGYRLDDQARGGPRGRPQGHAFSDGIIDHVPGILVVQRVGNVAPAQVRRRRRPIHYGK
jgi:hypothetical protein